MSRRAAKPQSFRKGLLTAAGWGIGYTAALAVGTVIGLHVFAPAQASTDTTPVAPVQQVVQLSPAEFDRIAAAFNTAHGCVTPAAWPKGSIPARMVEHADGSAALQIVKWTYPAAKGEWVTGLCK